MANGEIKTKLTLDGEKEYKRKLDEAYSSLRVLRSELKAETAEMGRNATAQDKATKKAESLRKQIAEQEKIVNTLKDALNQVKTQYADNAELQHKWEEKLNNARTVLANMKNQLDAAGSAVGDFNGAVSDVQGETGNAVQGVVDLGDAIDALKGIAGTLASTMGDAFSGMLENVKVAVTEAWALVSDTMAAAHDWKGIQEMYGGDLSEIQRYFRTAEFGGFDSGTLTTAINKMITQTNNGDKELMALLDEWGISESEYGSHWEYFTAVFDRIVAESTDKYGNVDTAKARKFAAAVFGDKQASNITGLISNWAESAQNYARDIEETGIQMSSAEIKEVDDMWQKVNDIKVTWDALREYAGMKIILGLELGDGAEKVQNLINDLAKLFANPADNEITKTIVMDVQAIFDWATAALGSLSDWLGAMQSTFEESDDPTMQNIAGIFKAVKELVDWINANSEIITSALRLWVEFKIADIETKLKTGLGIEEWISTLKEIGGNVITLVGIARLTDAGKLFGSATAGAAKAASGAGDMTGTGSKNIFSAMLSSSWFQSFATIGTMAYGYIELLKGAGQWRTSNADKVSTEKEYVQAAKEQEESVYSALSRWIEIQNVFNSDEAFSMTNEQVTALADEAEKLFELLNGTDLYERYMTNHFATDAGTGGRYSTLEELDFNIDAEERKISNAMDTLDARARTMFTTIVDNVTNSISNVKVYMDGHEVGVLVAGYVDQELAAGMR